MTIETSELLSDARTRERLEGFVRAAGFDPAELVDAYAFGHEAELIDRLAELVVAGPKRATTALRRWYEPGGERFPVAGDLAVVVDSRAWPRAVIRVTRVDVQPFRTVDAAFAWDEGEGDRSLESWRATHRAFFAAEATRSNFAFAEDDEVVLCRFALLWPVADRAPVAKRVAHTWTLHGETRVDEYAWLREKTNPDVRAYLTAENAYTAAVMAGTRDLQTALYDEMLAHIEQTDLSAPYRHHGAWYYTRTQAGCQYPIHCRRVGAPSAPEEVVLDLNELAAGKAFLSLDAFEISDDGNLLAYSLDDSGYRQYVLFVTDLRTGRVLDERIERVTGVAWGSDNRTLFYTTEDPVTKRADAVWRHELGAERSDRIFFEADESFDVEVTRTRDGQLILIRSEAKDTSDIRYLPADGSVPAPIEFRERRDGVRYDLDIRGDRLYVRSNEDAPDFRIFTTPLAQPGRAFWTELVAERHGTTITGIDVFAHFVAVSGRRDGRSSIEVLTPDGVLAPLTFDEPDYFVRLDKNCEFDTPTLRYVYESLVTPPGVYDLDVAGGGRTLVKQIRVPGFDPAAYVAERFFAAAADGTPIPISIVRRHDVPRDGSAALLLYAYGSYGISIDPTFSAARLPLLDRGMTYAIAHVRGGGEYGEAWRLAGNLFEKRTTFTDFIDCASALIDAGYTSRERLAVSGASAGGLLVGAVLNLRPDLFAAAVAGVPFVDVLTTMLDATLPLTTGEYREWGNPNDPATYAYLRSYSPLDNVVAQPYPAVLVEVGFNDSQVLYWEGAKYAAKMRAHTTSVNPVLLKANMEAGHGGASGRYDALRERAFEAAFVLTQTGYVCR